MIQFFCVLLNVVKDLELMCKSFTSFSEFQIDDAAWLNALDEHEGLTDRRPGS